MQAAAHTISRFSDRRITLLYRLSRPWHNPRHFTGKIQMYLADLHHKWNPPYSKAQPGTTIYMTVCSVRWRKYFTKSGGLGKWRLLQARVGQLRGSAGKTANLANGPCFSKRSRGHGSPGSKASRRDFYTKGSSLRPTREPFPFRKTCAKIVFCDRP